MASFITAGNATNGLQVSSDNTGILQLKSGTGAGTTAITVDASQNTTFAGQIRGNAASTPPTFADSAGTQIGTLCRAWVNFNGSTAAIRSSFNVSSVTRIQTGSYTITFSTAMPDSNFAVSGAAIYSATGSQVVAIAPDWTPSANNIKIVTTQAGSGGGSFGDQSYVTLSVFR